MAEECPEHCWQTDECIKQELKRKQVVTRCVMRPVIQDVDAVQDRWQCHSHGSKEKTTARLRNPQREPQHNGCLPFGRATLRPTLKLAAERLSRRQSEQ